MKRSIIWFVMGFVVSWLIWSVVAHIRLRPRDYTASWSTTQQELAPDWMKKAKGRRIGNFMVFTPADSAIAAAYIHPPIPNQFPGVFIQDKDADGRLDSILIADSAYQYVSLNDKTSDGVFDSLNFSTALSQDSMFFTDSNMDGEYDTRLGPGRAIAVTIAGQWYDLIHTNNKQYVKIGEVLTPVKAFDGVWKAVDEE